MLSSFYIRISEWILELPECQGTPCSKEVRYLKFLSDSNGIWTHNHLVRKRKLNHLAKPVIFFT